MGQIKDVVDVVDLVSKILILEQRNLRLQTTLDELKKRLRADSAEQYGVISNYAFRLLATLEKMEYRVVDNFEDTNYKSADL